MLLEKYPLTTEQYHIWLAQQLYPQTSEFNIGFTFEILGDIDIARFTNAFQSVVRNSDAMNMSIISIEDIPYLYSLSNISFDMPVYDLQNESDAPRTFYQKAHKLHHFTKWSDGQYLFNTALFRLGTNYYGWYLCLNHLIGDVKSIELIVRDVANAYFQSSVPPKRLAYTDYLKRFSDIEFIHTNKAVGKPELGRPVFFGKTHKTEQIDSFCELVSLESATLHSLQELTRNPAVFYKHSSITIANIITAAFATFLSRNLSSNKFSFALTLQNRPEAFLQTIGFFSTMTRISTDIDDQCDFQTLVQNFHQVIAEKMSVVKANSGELESEQNYDIAVNYQYFDLQSIGPYPLVASKIASQHSLRSLTLNIYDFAKHKEILLGIDFATDCFDDAMRKRFMRNWLYFLEYLLNHSNAPLWSIPLMTEAEYSVIADWNKTEKSQAQLNIIEKFEEASELYPDRAALKFGTETLTYREFNIRVNQLAHHLNQQGVKRETNVGIMMQSSFSSLVAIMAILKAGGCYVPLDIHYPMQRLKYMMQKCELQYLILDEPSKEDFGIPITIIYNADFRASLTKMPSNSPKIEIYPYQNFYIMFTSGSTGEPKGVAISHEAVSNLMQWQDSVLPVDEIIHTLQFTTLSFDVSVQEIFHTLINGGTLFLIEKELRQDFDGLWKYLLKEEITRLFLPYVALHHLAKFAADFPIENTRLLHVITAGEQLKIDQSLLDLFERLPEIKLHNMYGPTESHVVTSYTLPEDRRLWDELPPIGKPIDNVQIYILDTHKQIVPIGVVGEIYIAGCCLSQGYVQAQNLTDERFIILNLRGKTLRAYRTGDLAFYRNDGAICYLGRHDQQVKVRGHRVEIGEIEAVLGSHPSIQNLGVVLNESVLVAYLVLIADKPVPTVQTLRNYLSQYLPDYMIPVHYYFLTQLPLTPSGKLDRLALPLQTGIPAIPQDKFFAPENETEELLVTLWKRLLQIERVGREDNFFELGGNSLMALQLVALVRQELNVSILIADVFNRPILGDLAQLITGRIDRAIDEQGNLLDDLSDEDEAEFFRLNSDLVDGDE